MDQPEKIDIIEEIEDKKFYMQTKNFFLTYANVPEHWTKEYVKEQLIDELLVYRYKDKSGKGRQYKTRVRAYVIAEEEHKEKVGEGDYERGAKHYHCLIELSERMIVKNSRFFDIDGVHGNYQKTKDIFSALNYVKKYGNYIGDGFMGVKNELRNVIEAKTAKEAKMMLLNKMKPEAVLEVRREIINLKGSEVMIQKIMKGEVPEYEFQKKLKPFTNEAGFLKGGRPKALLMYGEPNSGKTTMAWRIAAELKWGVVVVGDPREMAYCEEEQIFLFDEMTEKKLTECDDILKRLITDTQMRAPLYYGGGILRYPRKVLMATNEDVSKWKISVGMRDRLIVVKTYSDGSYVYQKFDKEERLKDMTKEEEKEMIEEGSFPRLS